jgi:uncharacterized repeat protein (TIGR01451 family)
VISSVTHYRHTTPNLGAGVARLLKVILAGFAIRNIIAYSKAFAVLSMLLVGVSFAATPPNTAITNTASSSYNMGATSATSLSNPVIITTDATTPSTTEFLQYVPSGSGLGGSSTPVSATQCSTSGSNAGPYVPSTGPIPLGASAPLTIPGVYNVLAAQQYAIGEPVLVRVTDYNRNLDPNVAETVNTTITSSTGDSETLLLTETGLSTGVFVGYIQSTGGTVVQHDCYLNVSADVKLTASYVDTTYTTDTSASNVLVDPNGILFDSATGAPVNGATVTLIDNATGLPATVYGVDGVSTYPSTVTSGGTATDSSGRVYVFVPGGYEFPRLIPGTYHLVITPPAVYAFPSTVPTASLPPKSPGVPYNVVTGSRGENFVVAPGPIIVIDVPLDPSTGGVQITKTASKATGSAGDFIPYVITIHNNGAAPIANLQIKDTLPLGFRYKTGSTYLDGVKLADPVIASDGRRMIFSLSTLAASATVTLKYVAEISAGAVAGNAENTAVAINGVSSNTARATVLVTEDLMRSKAILMGRVIVGGCDGSEKENEIGLQGARIVMENGTYILTDKDGKWHVDNITPGTHVVQLDKDSLPADYEVMTCEQNTRFAGRNYSQFVNVRGGTLWRADFHVRKKPVAQICLNQQLSTLTTAGNTVVALGLSSTVPVTSTSTTIMLPAGSTLKAGSATLDGAAYPDAVAQDGMMTVRLPQRTGVWQSQFKFELTGVADNAEIKAMSRVNAGGQPAQALPVIAAKTDAPAQQCAPFVLAEKPAEVPTTGANQRKLNLVEQLPYDDDWLATAQPGVEWLHPQSNFYPAIPAIKVAIKQAPTDKVELRINGELADVLAYDGMAVNATRTVALATWRGLVVKEGDNEFAVTVRNADGKVIKQETRMIHYSTSPTRASLDEKQSHLFADGKTRPVIAVRLVDKDGFPVRRGLSGEFQINEPYQSADRAEALQRDPLAGKLGGQARFEVGADGIAYIALMPTTQTGEVVLNFTFGALNDRKQEVRAWLAPGKRDWILVGFANGTLGQKSLSGNMEALTGSAADEKLFDKNQIAFYAKGQIKGQYLLTMAYDTAKASGNPIPSLKQAIDPNAYYTLYADATQPLYDAASARKLYLKIEKDQFYAMFGDFDTGMTVTQYSRYSRTLNGLKSEYKGKDFSYTAFATMTAQAFVRDEIRGDGTSGLYRLSRNHIVLNSDKVRMEVRDRFHSEIVLSTQTFTRYLDYDIDYINGTLFFRQPIPATDANFNPVYIVAEYEAGSTGDAKLTYGGRAAYRPNDKTEVGVTHVREGNVGNSGNLSGVDVTIKPDDKTIVKAEYAMSDKSVSGINASGNAMLVEATRQDGNLTGRTYYRQQDAGFGLGQQPGSETGTRKIGGDLRLKVTETMQLQGEMYRQNMLTTGAQRDLAEARLQWRKDELTTNAGLRVAQDVDGAGNTTESKQVVAGAEYALWDKKVILRAKTEIGIASASSSAQSVDFPNRLTVGADYKLTQETVLFASQEFAKGASLTSNATRIGLRTLPWTGGEVSASVGNQSYQDSGRLFGNLGMVQRLQINEFWRADFGLDRSQTISNQGVTPINLNAPLTSGTPAGVAGDYNAFFAGVGYNDKVWSANSRVELRNSDIDKRVNLLAGVQRNLDEGRSVAAGFILLKTNSATLKSEKTTLRLSAAYRPWDSPWIWLDRLDLIDQSNTDVTGSIHSSKLVNNFNANYKPNLRTQIALQYGAKFAHDVIDGTAYTSYTDLMGLEARYDITQDWDVGINTSVLHTWGSGQKNYSLGGSVGYKLMTNTWVAIGYNIRGFADADFAGADYRTQGFYLSMRVKFDQDTLGLNKPNGPSLTRP